MNLQTLKLLPAMLGNNKKSVSLLIALIGVWQIVSPRGVGADWGVPSIDTLYQEPRDVLATRVELAKEGQEAAAQEFQTALEKFKQVTHFDGGDLEDKFNAMSAAYERSDAVASRITVRVDRVVAATNNLLQEWRDELDRYHDRSIRQRAEQQFDATRTQAEQLIALMRQSEAKTKPVLGAFRDQVLFVKHNLNTQAIMSLESEIGVIEQDVSALIDDMKSSIAEAERFLQQMESNS